MALVAVFTTCEKNENSVVLGDKENPMPIFYSELVNDFKYIYTSSIKDIYNKAYDGENIDEKKALSIFSSYSKDRTNVDLFNNYIPLMLTRGADNNTDIIQIIEETFSEEQIILINELLGHESINEDILLTIKNKALLLSKNESKTIVDIIDIIQISINEIEKYLTIENSITSTRSKGSTFACNLGAGMVGGVAGFLAGALSGTVTGPGGLAVGFIVSTTVGAYISTHAC